MTCVSLPLGRLSQDALYYHSGPAPIPQVGGNGETAAEAIAVIATFMA